MWWRRRETHKQKRLPLLCSLFHEQLVSGDCHYYVSRLEYHSTNLWNNLLITNLSWWESWWREMKRRDKRNTYHCHAPWLIQSQSLGSGAGSEGPNHWINILIGKWIRRWEILWRGKDFKKGTRKNSPSLTFVFCLWQWKGYFSRNLAVGWVVTAQQCFSSIFIEKLKWWE